MLPHSLSVYKYSLATVTVTRLTVKELREEAELARLGVGDSGPLGTSCSGF